MKHRLKEIYYQDFLEQECTIIKIVNIPVRYLFCFKRPFKNARNTKFSSVIVPVVLVLRI
jgi:hypothetical protein